MRLQATQEGLVPLKAWVKSALDEVIQVCMDEPGLEFVWVGDDAVDPLQQAQTLEILVSAGIKTRDEARAELGLGGTGPSKVGLGKYNHNHDERGRFTTADGAAKPRDAAGSASSPSSLLVAGGDNIATDAIVDGYPEGWQACHEKCLAQTEGVWPPSDRPALYRRCMRECLGPAGESY